MSLTMRWLRYHRIRDVLRAKLRCYSDNWRVLIITRGNLQVKRYLNNSPIYRKVNYIFLRASKVNINFVEK